MDAITTKLKDSEVTVTPNSTGLSILNTQIRRDAEGRFCLNDCHKASGTSSAKQPANWLRLDSTQALVAELGNSSDLMSIAQKEGRNGGTYVSKELVYAYGMWISPAFHLTVIRAFDGLVSTMQSHVAVASLDAEARKALGGIIKSVAGKAIEDRLAPVEAAVLAIDKAVQSLLSGYDPRATVTDYLPMLDILVSEGVASSKKRRPLSTRCSKSCLSFCIASGKNDSARESRETGRWLFRQDVAREWLEKVGRRLIAEHKEKIEGQTLLTFPKPKSVPPKPKLLPRNSPEAGASA